MIAERENEALFHATYIYIYIHYDGHIFTWDVDTLWSPIKISLKIPESGVLDSSLTLTNATYEWKASLIVASTKELIRANEMSCILYTSNATILWSRRNTRRLTNYVPSAKVCNIDLFSQENRGEHLSDLGSFDAKAYAIRLTKVLLGFVQS